LGAYLVKSAVLSEADLLQLGKAGKDFELAKTLISAKRISSEQAEQLQVRLAEDILRLALLWDDGTWNFDHRSQINEDVTFHIDAPALLLETARRLPAEVIVSRFRNPNEHFSPVAVPPNSVNLSPAEGFLLSRIDAPVTFQDLSMVSGLAESELQRVVYSLALVDFINRESWENAFRSVPQEPVKVIKEAPAVEIQAPTVVNPPETVESLLKRLAHAQSHYEVLDVAPDAPMSELKNAYYNLARKYHPDRFRHAESSLIARIESAFARITQAYDTLRDPGLRSSYDSKLEAQARSARVARAAPKAEASSDAAGSDATSATEGDSNQSELTVAQRAEAQFKEGFAALELGQRNVAMGLLASAARAVPTESRYRAYYGRVLALSESTRRLAESELLAAIKLEPNNSEYRVMLAELYKELGFNVRARSEAERAVASDQNNRKARELLKSLS
jgi:curved DNA-binding protein CbpA